MSIQTEIERLENTKSTLKAVIEYKGITVPDDVKLNQYPGYVYNIPTGTDTSDATAEALDIIQDKTAYVDGEKITGAIPLYTGVVDIGANTGSVWIDNGIALSFGANGRVALEDGCSIRQNVPGSMLGNATESDVAKGVTFTSTNGMMLTGTKEAETANLQSKSVTPTETAQTVRPDSGYDGLSTVSVGAISKTYVGSNVPTLAANTITPGTNNITIPGGTYLTGTQTVKGDTNLKAENIKSGVSIFNVLGSFEGSSGGGLPTGVSAIAAGSEIMEENVAYYNVTHNLGVIPDFIVWWIDDDLSNAVLTSAATQGATILKANKYTSSSSIIYNIHNLIAGYGSSSQAAGTATRVSNSSYMTTTTARMVANTTYYLKAGKKYHWICGKLA